MPNPNKFKTKAAFMAVCIPEVIGEGKTQAQAAGKCSGMWAGRKPKTNACGCGLHTHALRTHAAPHLKDPTRTKTLRDLFQAEMVRRFQAVWVATRRWLVEEDGLGYFVEQSRKRELRSIGLSQEMKREEALALLRTAVPFTDMSLEKYLSTNYDYPLAPEKLAAFRKYIDKQIEKELLTAIPPATSAGWMNGYLDSSYKQAIRRANQELVKEGFQAIDVPTDPVGASLLSPVHARDLAFIYQRDYALLKNVTVEMSNKMSDILAEGLAKGLSPNTMARTMSKQVGMSKRRAKTIARTEIVRTHHLGLHRQYKEAGMKQVKFQVEFKATGDERMCIECGFLDGHIFNLDDTLDLIPVHPNCRCVMLPHRQDLISPPAPPPEPEPTSVETPTPLQNFNALPDHPAR